VNSPLAFLLIAAIHAYRLMAQPITRSRSCLYNTSCSRHVERVARDAGFLAAVAAMRQRFSACRPGYTFEYDDAGWWIVCKDGQRIQSSEVSSALVVEAKACCVPVNGPASRGR
jgi:uncharacterized protein